MVTYTPILKLTQPDFDQTPWDEQINGDLAILDAAFGKFFAAPGLSGVWQNATTYVVGQSVVEPVDSTIWTCQVSNTSAAAPTTFAQDRTAHPTYWTTTGTVSGYLPTTGGTLTGNLGISGPVNTTRGIDFLTSGSIRWLVQAGGEPESGGNAGSDFSLVRYSDAGASIDIPLSVNRATGQIGLNNQTFVSAPLTATQLVSTSSVSGTSLNVTPTGAYITGDANYTQFVQDGGLWRWQYTRTNGLMQYVRGSDNTPLLSIDGVGGLTVAGGINAPGTVAFGNVSSSSSITAQGNITAAGSLYGTQVVCYGTALFAYSQVTDFYMGRVTGFRFLSFGSGYQFRWNEVTTEFEWINNNALVMKVGVSGDLTLTATLSCNSTGVRYPNIGSNGFNFRWGSPTAYIRVDNAVEIGIQQVSDERMKQDIAPSTFDCLAAVKATPLFEFRWQNASDPVKVTRNDAAPIVPIGFVAQRQHEVFPDSVVPGSADGEGIEGATTMWQMNHNTLCATLFGAVQQLTARVEALEQQLAGRADS